MVLVVDRNTVRRIAANPAVTAEFPFLADYAKKPKRGCCGGAAVPRIDGTPALRQIRDLPKDRQSRLKAILGTDTIRLRIVQAGRSLIVNL